jgi:hypothetical protein
MIKDPDRRQLERKIAQANRLAATVLDQTTQRRLNRLRDELAESLRKYPDRRARISEEQVRARAHELWEAHGRPQGRDEEFWVQAERELVDSGNAE